MVGTGHMPTSSTRHPLDNRPATTACLTISPEVLGSRPMTIVPKPTYVPNACANRVKRAGVNESPITPRTPEMLILRVGIARMCVVGLGSLVLGLGSLVFGLCCALCFSNCFYEPKTKPHYLPILSLAQSIKSCARVSSS